MIEHNIAKRYARALLSVALDGSRDNADKYGDELATFGEACRSHAALLDTLSNRYFDMFARERIVDALAAKMGLAVPVKNFIKLLIHKGRIGLFPTIVTAYRVLAHEVMGREIMTVVSATPLPEAQYGELSETFAKITGKKMVVERKTVPEVLGGVRVHIHDTVYDYTVQNQIEQMKHRMLA